MWEIVDSDFSFQLKKCKGVLTKSKERIIYIIYNFYIIIII